MWMKVNETAMNLSQVKMIEVSGRTIKFRFDNGMSNDIVIKSETDALNIYALILSEMEKLGESVIRLS